MGKNCNLELRLLTPSVSLHSSDNHQPPMMDLLNGSPNEEKEQPLTIFYNGKISVCDVTELQARAIILLASQEMENKLKSPSGGSDPSSPLILPSPTGLSMKKSLQRFLQKRKHRVQAASPYNH